MDIIREERRNPKCSLLKLHSDEERARGQLKLEETDAKNGGGWRKSGVRASTGQGMCRKRTNSEGENVK